MRNGNTVLAATVNQRGGDVVSPVVSPFLHLKQERDREQLGGKGLPHQFEFAERGIDGTNKNRRRTADGLKNFCLV
jgi:hypothetical protein